MLNTLTQYYPMVAQLDIKSIWLSNNWVDFGLDYYGLSPIRHQIIILNKPS